MTNLCYHATRKQVNIQTGFHLNDDGKMVYIKTKVYAPYIFATLCLKESNFETKKNDVQILEL